jgi:hypothetical protein
MPKIYRVQARGEGCPTCQHGDQFDIIGPDETAQSQSWGDPEEAQYICDLMNDAYVAGRASFAQQILEMTKEEPEHAEAQTVEAPPTPIIQATSDDIPF